MSTPTDTAKPTKPRTRNRNFHLNAEEQEILRSSFFWDDKTNTMYKKAGTIMKTTKGHASRRMSVGAQRSVALSAVVWFLEKGEILDRPPIYLDGDPTNCRIDNLARRPDPSARDAWSEFSQDRKRREAIRLLLSEGLDPNALPSHLQPLAVLASGTEVSGEAHEEEYAEGEEP